jgi:hypothetical protein
MKTSYKTSDKKKKATGDCTTWTGRFALKNVGMNVSEILTPFKEAFVGTPKVVHAAFKGVDEITAGHAFLQDDEFVYEKKANVEDYSIFNRKEYYTHGVMFNLYGTPTRMKIVDHVEHAFDELVDLMVGDGGRYGLYGVTTDI